jgi:hypothetical protein
MLVDDDDDSSSSADSSQMTKSSCTSGSWQKRHDSAFQVPDSNKECIFHCTLAMQHTMDWDCSDVAEDCRKLTALSHLQALAGIVRRHSLTMHLHLLITM